MPTPVSRPSNYPLPFASSGTKNTIPTPATGTGKASFTEGFPAVTMRPIVAGGIPPEGKDFNGILYDITTHTVWLNAGGQYQFDATLSTAIGGYPAGMVLQNNAGTGAYVSAVNNNTTDFNTTPASIGTLWMPWAGQALQNAAIIWCGTSAGSANAQTFTPTPAVAAYVAGQTFSGVAGFTNTGSLTINISGLGPIVVKRDSTSGPVPLTGGEWVAGNVVTLKYDGSFFQLTDSDLGDLAMLNIGRLLEADGAGNLRVKASDNVGTLSAIQAYAGNPNGHVAGNAAVAGVSAPSGCWDTLNNLFYFCSVSGNAATAVWLQQTPSTFGAAKLTYINSSQAVGPGGYLVDTSAGPITLTLSGSPSVGDNYNFVDAAGTWSPNNLTLNRNSLTIMGLAEDLTCNVIGEDFRIWYDGTTWRLQ